MADAAVILPWPPKSVWPNFRSSTHWARTSGLKKARHWGRVAARGSKLRPSGDGVISIEVTFHRPPRSRPDRDNCLSAVKAYLDAIAEVWGVNDSRFDPKIVMGEPKKGGEVVVRIG